jgi:hypothetical protein
MYTGGACLISRSSPSMARQQLPPQSPGTCLGSAASGKQTSHKDALLKLQGKICVCKMQHYMVCDLEMCCRVKGFRLQRQVTATAAGCGCGIIACVSASHRAWHVMRQPLLTTIACMPRRIWHVTSAAATASAVAACCTLQVCQHLTSAQRSQHIHKVPGSNPRHQPTSLEPLRLAPPKSGRYQGPSGFKQPTRG